MINGAALTTFRVDSLVKNTVPAYAKLLFTVATWEVESILVSHFVVKELKVKNIIEK